MAIKQFVRVPHKIIDRRESGKNYYIAVCDVCDIEYYPNRSSSKYCSNSCAQKAYHKRVEKEGKKLKKITARKTSASTKIKGWNNVYQFLKERYKTKGKKAEIIALLKNLPIDDSITYGDHQIHRFAPYGFSIT